MSKARMIGAGAGGTQYGVLTSRNQGGGDKKQGLVSTTNTRVDLNAFIRIRGGGHNRNWIFCMNQLGGVGHRWGQAAGPGNRGGVSSNCQRLAYRRRQQYPPKPCGAQVRGWGAGVKFPSLCRPETGAATSLTFAGFVYAVIPLRPLVFVVCGDTITALGQADASLAWTWAPTNAAPTPPVLSADGQTLFTSDSKGSVYSLQAKSGTVTAAVQVSEKAFASSPVLYTQDGTTRVVVCDLAGAAWSRFAHDLGPDEQLLAAQGDGVAGVTAQARPVVVPSRSTAQSAALVAVMGGQPGAPVGRAQFVQCPPFTDPTPPPPTACSSTAGTSSCASLQLNMACDANQRPYLPCTAQSVQFYDPTVNVGCPPWLSPGPCPTGTTQWGCGSPLAECEQELSTCTILSSPCVDPAIVPGGIHTVYVGGCDGKVYPLQLNESGGGAQGNGWAWGTDVAWATMLTYPSSFNLSEGSAYLGSPTASIDGNALYIGTGGAATGPDTYGIQEAGLWALNTDSGQALWVTRIGPVLGAPVVATINGTDLVFCTSCTGSFGASSGSASLWALDPASGAKISRWTVDREALAVTPPSLSNDKKKLFFAVRFTDATPETLLYIIPVDDFTASTVDPYSGPSRSYSLTGSGGASAGRLLNPWGLAPACQ